MGEMGLFTASTVAMAAQAFTRARGMNSDTRNMSSFLYVSYAAIKLIFVNACDIFLKNSTARWKAPFRDLGWPLGSYQLVQTSRAEGSFPFRLKYTSPPATAFSSDSSFTRIECPRRLTSPRFAKSQERHNKSRLTAVYF